METKLKKDVKEIGESALKAAAEVALTAVEFVVEKPVVLNPPDKKHE